MKTADERKVLYRVQIAAEREGENMEYHKIQTVYKRDPATNHKTLLMGEYSMPEFEYLRDNAWVFTEKVDGTNIRVMYDGKSLTFGGKTDKAQIPAPLLSYLQDKYFPMVTIFSEQFGEVDVCFYGEGYGAKIQKGGGNYSPEQRFVLFDIRIGRWWLKRGDVEELAKYFRTDTVPIIGTGTLTDMVNLAQDGFNSRWGDFQAEGIVARPAVELINRHGDRIITKIKSKDFKG